MSIVGEYTDRTDAARAGARGGVEFGVLGPLEMRVGGAPVALGPPRQQRFLVALLADAGRVVPLDRIFTTLWEPGRFPTSARTQVQICASAVRRTLGAVGLRDVIHTRPPGYLLRIGGEPRVRLDTAMFTEHVRLARSLSAAGDLAEAAERYRAADELWRGPALAGFRDGELAAVAAYWEQQRLSALEESLEIDLRLGRHTDLVAKLLRLTAEYPYHEKLLAALMIALQRDGQPAAALDRYRRYRHDLSDSLGLRPTPNLDRLNDLIIRGATDLLPSQVWETRS